MTAVQIKPPTFVTRRQRAPPALKQEPSDAARREAPNVLNAY
jgi:hypothetical protein